MLTFAGLSERREYARKAGIQFFERSIVPLLEQHFPDMCCESTELVHQLETVTSEQCREINLEKVFSPYVSKHLQEDDWYPEIVTLTLLETSVYKLRLTTGLWIPIGFCNQNKVLRLIEVMRKHTQHGFSDKKILYTLIHDFSQQESSQIVETSFIKELIPVLN
jgi:hypothetical protein